MKGITMLQFTILIVFMGHAVTAQRVYMYTPESDCYGNDISTTLYDPEDPDKCTLGCDNTEGCVALVVYENICYFKSNCPALVYLDGSDSYLLVENVAFGKTTSQVSRDFSGFAYRAVDGFLNQNYDFGSCTHTASQANPWWMVDLGSTHKIAAVGIVNRAVFASRLTNIEVQVSDSSTGFDSSDVCVAYPGQIPSTPVLNVLYCDATVMGRYVRVQLFRDGYLTLCEVEVYGLVPVNGGLSEWSAFGACSVYCGDGIQRRTRTCTNPEPENGGVPCSDTYSVVQERGCNAGPCPDDGGWSEWSAFSTCSVSCGDGIRRRTRECTNPEPTNGGALCPGNESEEQACYSGLQCSDSGVGTFGGNALGATCSFPFIYNGEEYTGCTMEGHVRMWCSTTRNFDTDRRWGNCIIGDRIFTEGGNAGGSPCVFPFYYGGRRYTECTQDGHVQLWCATTEDYAADRRWGNCIILDEIVVTPGTTPVYTFGGNAEGANCFFPFMYNGRRYTECTMDGHVRLWCAITANYNEDKFWGNCILYD